MLTVEDINDKEIKETLTDSIHAMTAMGNRLNWDFIELGDNNPAPPELVQMTKAIKRCRFLLEAFEEKEAQGGDSK